MLIRWSYLLLHFPTTSKSSCTTDTGAPSEHIPTFSKENEPKFFPFGYKNKLDHFTDSFCSIDESKFKPSSIFFSFIIMEVKIKLHAKIVFYSNLNYDFGTQLILTILVNFWYCMSHIRETNRNKRSMKSGIQFCKPGA